MRACQNRALEQAEQTERSHDHLREIVLKSPVLFTQEIKVRGRKTKTTCEKRGRRTARTSRKTTVEVRAATITLRPPPRPDRELPPVTLQVVLVREPNPPQGEAAIEWLLVTTLPIETVDQVRQIVQYYCVRWQIEAVQHLDKAVAANSTNPSAWTIYFLALAHHRKGDAEKAEEWLARSTNPEQIPTPSWVDKIRRRFLREEVEAVVKTKCQEGSCPR